MVLHVSGKYYTMMTRQKIMKVGSEQSRSHIVKYRNDSNAVSQISFAHYPDTNKILNFRRYCRRWRHRSIPQVIKGKSGTISAQGIGINHRQMYFNTWSNSQCICWRICAIGYEYTISCIYIFDAAIQFNVAHLGPAEVLSLRSWATTQNNLIKIVNFFIASLEKFPNELITFTIIVIALNGAFYSKLKQAAFIFYSNLRQDKSVSNTWALGANYLQRETLIIAILSLGLPALFAQKAGTGDLFHSSVTELKDGKTSLWLQDCWLLCKDSVHITILFSNRYTPKKLNTEREGGRLYLNQNLSDKYIFSAI